MVTTFAGQASLQGSADGTGSAARFVHPSGIAVDSSGNVLVADGYNLTIRRITPAGVVSTLAGAVSRRGSSDGSGSSARFAFNSGGAVDTAGNLYVADSTANTVRRITPAGVVTTVAGRPGLGSADGTGAAALFDGPQSAALDPSGNLIVADSYNHTLRKMTPTGVVTTLAGLAGEVGSTDSVTGGAARFNSPDCVAVDAAGNIYVADRLNCTIRKISPSGAVTTLAGTAGLFGSADGTGGAASFSFPNGVALDGAGNLYVSDSGNYLIRRIVLATGVVTTVAGFAGQQGSADGTGTAARFNNPRGVAFDPATNILYASDYGAVRKITAAGVVTTLAGVIGTGGNIDGTGTVARFDGNFMGSMDAAGNILLADRGSHVIRQITPSGVVTTVAGIPYYSGRADGAASFAQFLYPASPVVDSAGRLYVADGGNNTIRLGDVASVPPVIASISAPRQVVSLGQNLDLTVTATSSTALTYQWKRNGFPVAGAISATYPITTATPARDNGWYQVVVTNGTGSTTSAVVFVNVAVNPSQVAGWGYGYFGQTALQTGLGGVSALAVGTYHSLALRADGTVAAWGSNSYGETSVPAGLSGVVAVAGGSYFSLALKSDGTVVAWGNNGNGQVAGASGLSGVVAIAAGNSHALALKSNGTVVGWGWNAYSQTTIPFGLSDVVAIGGGTYHSIALKSDGTVAGWGLNGNNQSSPPVGLTGVQRIAAGGYFNLVLKSDGTVALWGSAGSSQLTPPVGLNDVVAISCGGGHCLALKSDGTAVGWGDNFYSQSSLSVGLANVLGIYGGGSSTLVLRNPSGDTALPSITTQPATQTAYLTGTVNLTVTLASNPAPASYQWRKAGNPLFGANNATYTIYGAQSSDAGSYDVVVTNGVGSVTSASATLTVVNPPPPTITTPPADGILNVDNVGSFRVIASSPVYPTYQWRKNGTPLTGKNDSLLLLGAVQLADAGTYDVVVTNSGGSVTSAPATLVVHPFTAPTFTTQPVGGIIDVGNVAHFFATVTGAVPLSYQWLKDGAPLAGATGPTLILGNAQLADAGVYTLVATNGIGSTTSAGATLLFPSQLTLPTVSQTPANQVALVGVTASLSIVATGVPAPTLQWRRNGVPLAGATSATYNIGLVQENDGGSYDVVVTNFKGSIVSTPATLTVQGRPVIWTARLALGAGDAVGTFTLEGTASKRLLLRAVGPTLSMFGVSDPLADPKLEIYDNAGQLVATNDDWSTHADQPGLISASAAAGAFALSSGSKDAVVLRTYAPGTYFARTSAASGAGRIVLLELYDAEPASLSRVPYTAVRGSAAPSGGEIVVGGLGANGTSQRTYLLRASGPALGSVGTLPNPTFTVLRDSVARAGNDDWQTGSDTAGVAAAAARVGTFAFADGSRDSALLVTAYVRSGLYIGQVAGAGGNSGLVLAEAIEADDSRPTAYAPAVVSPPASRVSPAGTNLTLEARATGTAPVLYQWRKDGVTLNGATLRSLALPNVVPANAGVYTVVASNAHGTALSLPAVLTIDSAVAVPVATHAVAPPGGYVAGSTLLINNTLTYPGVATGLGWTVTLPAGWSYAGGGGAEGDVKPAIGATGTLEWSWSTPPTSPVNFSYTLNVPPGETNIRSLGATALVRTATSVQTVTTTPTPLLLIPLVALHSADTNQDFAIGLFELTRVIELYNTRLGTTRTGCYAVATTAGSEDGFVVDALRSGGTVVTLSRYHSADSTKDGKFSLTELTRVIELFNTRSGTTRTGTYHASATTTEDGFAPGP